MSEKISQVQAAESVFVCVCERQCLCVGACVGVREGENMRVAVAPYAVSRYKYRPFPPSI